MEPLRGFDLVAFEAGAGVVAGGDDHDEDHAEVVVGDGTASLTGVELQEVEDVVAVAPLAQFAPFAGNVGEVPEDHDDVVDDGVVEVVLGAARGGGEE
jgi:hypothetical protein